MAENLVLVTLTGEFVRLEPPTVACETGLFQAGRDPEIWRWMSKRLLDKEQPSSAFIEEAMEAEGRGKRISLSRSSC